VLVRIALQMQAHQRMGGAVLVALSDDDLGGPGTRRVARDRLARLATQQPAVQPCDQRFAELDERDANSVVARAVHEQHADARPDLARAGGDARPNRAPLGFGVHSHRDSSQRLSRSRRAGPSSAGTDRVWTAP